MDIGGNWEKIWWILSEIWRIYAKELSAKFGGYCQKLENKMVEVSVIRERI